MCTAARRRLHRTGVYPSLPLRAYGSNQTLIINSGRTRAWVLATLRAVRAPLICLVVVACGSTPRPAPPVPSNEVRTCEEAAAGIEAGTKSVRDPDFSVLAQMRTRCNEDAWASLAVECFAELTEDKLGECAGKLDKDDRERLFGVLAGDYQGRTAIAIAIARLHNIKVGIPECDQFVAQVTKVLRSEAVPIETRVQLGNDTADFWSLPTTKLSADAQKRMGVVCSESLAKLKSLVQTDE